jgi:glycosyltransferase involved in cell wall biosynthesis
MHEGSGAGRAAARLHEGLRRDRIDSSMLVLQKSSHDDTIVPLVNPTKFVKRLQAKLLSAYLSKAVDSDKTFSINIGPSLTTRQIQQFRADIVNLHWIGWEYLKIEDLQALQVPLVWTLQDMWPFTGGCHYSEACDRYTHTCGQCPQLKASSQAQDMSRWVWQRKANAWKDLDLTIVAPGHWIAECARNSTLFKHLRVETIPFCLDTEAFKPIELNSARQQLNLPLDKQLVLFGALSATQDQRKGFQFLLPALQKLSESHWRDRLELVVFGSAAPKQALELGFKAHYLGHISDDASLAAAYSAADVMIVPSIQESFGQTASEALACGTPVVAFDATGPQDIINHQQNGYLAKPFSIDDLAQGIDWVLSDRPRQQQLCQQARESAQKNYSLTQQAQAYSALYEDILRGKPAKAKAMVSK